MSEVLAELDRILEERKGGGAPEGSYVASLYQAGLEKMLRKISEEATETILAAMATDGDAKKLPHLVEEVADLWFHSMVVLRHLGSDSAEVLAVLERRMAQNKRAQPQQ